MQKNTVKERLRAGECVYGTAIEDRHDPEVVVLLARAGFDFFFIDTEHSPAGYKDIQNLCRVARSFGLVPLVRVTENRLEIICRTLDVGAMGVIVPRVHSPEAGRAALNVIKFPPEGNRGYGLRSIVSDLQPISPPEAVASCNRETMAVLMIESRAGLEHVEEIAAIPGVDALFIGPFDLSLSLGFVGQMDHPDMLKALDRVIAATKSAGNATGIHTTNLPLLQEAKKRGARFLMYGSDSSCLFEGYKRAIGHLKG